MTDLMYMRCRASSVSVAAMRWSWLLAWGASACFPGRSAPVWWNAGMSAIARSSRSVPYFGCDCVCVALVFYTGLCSVLCHCSCSIAVLKLDSFLWNGCIHSGNTWVAWDMCLLHLDGWRNCLKKLLWWLLTVLFLSFGLFWTVRSVVPKVYSG